jgi:hypothetical protein
MKFLALVFGTLMACGQPDKVHQVQKPDNCGWKKPVAPPKATGCQKPKIYEVNYDVDISGHSKDQCQGQKGGWPNKNVIIGKTTIDHGQDQSCGNDQKGQKGWKKGDGKKHGLRRDSGQGCAQQPAVVNQQPACDQTAIQQPSCDQTADQQPSCDQTADQQPTCDQTADQQPSCDYTADQSTCGQAISVPPLQPVQPASGCAASD